MSSILGNSPMFRDAEDFRQDAAIAKMRDQVREWETSPEGRQVMAEMRERIARYERAARVMSQRYRSTQEWIEATLKGADAPLPSDPDWGSATDAIRRDGPAWVEECRWFSH